MASFDTLESGTEGSRPIEVYRFTLGSQEFFYSSSEDTITFGGDDYLPESIGRESIEIGQDARTKALDITVLATNPFALKYVSIVPGEKATCIITRLQRDESPTFATQPKIFRGVVQDVRYDDNGEVSIIRVQSGEAKASQSIPRFTYMAMCNHALYDGGCKVAAGSFQHTGNVSAESGNTITIAGASASGLDFVGGFCRPDGVSDFRLIRAQSGDVMTLFLPFAVPVLSTNVSAFAGCDHILTSDCAIVFDNVLEHGGHAFVPKRDIFANGLD